MTKENISFYTPFVDENEIDAITKALKSPQKWSSSMLEDELSNYLEGLKCVTVLNESLAITLTLKAYDIKRGDKVLISVNSSQAIPQAIRHFDCEPVFVDTMKDSYNIDLDSFENYLQKHSQKKLRLAIINFAIDSFFDLDRLYDICEYYNIVLIEVVNNGLGMRYKDKLIGQQRANATIFSINKTDNHRHLSSCGVITTNNQQIQDRLKLLRTDGIPPIYQQGDSLEYLYDVVDIGYKFDMDILNIVFSYHQLEKVDIAINKRIEIAKIYCDKLSNLKHIKVKDFDTNSIYTEFIIEVDKNRDAFAKELKLLGISTGLHYIPLHLLSYYKSKYNYKIVDFPNVLNSFSKILSLPIYANLSYSKVDYVCEKIIELDQKWR